MVPVQFHHNPRDEKLGTQFNRSIETLAQMNPAAYKLEASISVQQTKR